MLAEVDGCPPTLCLRDASVTGACMWVCMCVGIPHAVAHMGVLAYGFQSGHREQDVGVGIGAFWDRVKVQ